MGDFLLFIAAIVGLIVSIVLIVAQCQLFAIKKYLHDLLQIQLSLHGAITAAHIDSIAAGGSGKLTPLEVTVVPSPDQAAIKG